MLLNTLHVESMCHDAHGYSKTRTAALLSVMFVLETNPSSVRIQNSSVFSEALSHSVAVFSSSHIASGICRCCLFEFCLITSTANKSSLLSWRALLRSLVLRLLALRSSLATRLRSALNRACSSLRRSMLRPRDSGRSGPTPPASAAARLARLLAVEVAAVPFAMDVSATATYPEEEDELPVDMVPQQGPCLGLWHCLSSVCDQGTSC